jgi:hypothetical protein
MSSYLQLILSNQSQPDDVEVAVPSAANAVHRIFCIDVSGSMSSDLPAIRRQLKNKLPTSIRPQDFMTLIWFSGNGQFGAIFEHITINDLRDLTAITAAIDHYIKSVGSTGFIEPIRLAKRLAETYPEQPQVFFLTDGGENCWPRQECLDAFGEMNTIPLVIVEYQYYCDRVFLQKLADVSNATSVFNENFESYDVSFSTYMSNTVSKLKTVESGLPILYMDGETFVAKLPTADARGLFRIPEHVQRVWKVDTAAEPTATDEREAYLMLLFCVQTKQMDVMEKCANALGDVYVSKLISTCFSKQDASRLYDHLLNCVNDPVTYAFKEGVDTSYVVKNDVFTVIDVLQMLQHDAKTRYYPYHHSVKYNRISRDIEKDADAIEFIPNRDLGATINLVYHQSRANISVGCQIHGHEKDSNDTVKAVTAFRNYTIIKDGIKNMDTLAVSFSEPTFQALKATGVFTALPDAYENGVHVLDLKNLPVVNRLFAKVAFNSDEFCTAHVDLLYHKSQMKYVKKIKKELEASEEKDEKDESAPFERKKADPSVVRDFYVAPELQVKIAKCSSIPTVNDKLTAKLDGPDAKLTPSEWLMLDVHAEYKALDKTAEVVKTWLTTKQDELKKRVHDVTTFLEKAKMAILIGGCWFSNCTETDKTFSVTYKTKKFEVTVEVNDTTVYMS